MRSFDLIPAQFRIAIVVLLLVTLAAGSASLAWQVQAWRYDGKLARQASLQADDLHNLTQAALRQQQAEQDTRLATEQQLAISDQLHIRELSDAHRNQAALRDRLATADVRLSVLLDATDTASGCKVSTASGTVGVVYGARRAQLEPAHAQRIISITDAGDQGLIALRACQTYVKEVSIPK